MAILFRPVGLHELSLLWDMEWRGFPPRLPHQPIFYPVTNRKYAAQIASEWNVKDEASGFAGYVAEFSVADEYLAKFEPKTVGTSAHVEYWIPAEELASFNQQIIGTVGVKEAFFGRLFRGWIPEMAGLRGKAAVQQFVTLAKIRLYSPMDFACETAVNSKAVYINSWFWAQHDFSNDGLSADEIRETIGALQRVWEMNDIAVPLPAPLLGRRT